MGQQQLLLLVVGIVIVAVSVMAGLEIFQRGQRQDEADGLLERALAISTHAVYWKSKNDPFTGGNQSYQALQTNGIETLALDETTVRGRFRVTAATSRTLEVTGVSERYPEIGVRVFVSNYDIDSSRVAFDGSLAL